MSDARSKIQQVLAASLETNENFVASKSDPLVQALFSLAVEKAVFAREQGTSQDWPFGSIEHFVLAHGRLAKGWRPLPRGFAYGPLNLCFENSLRTVLDCNLGYVEGFVLRGNGIPVQHAWNVSPDGEVVDVTLRSPAEVAALAAELLADQESLSSAVAVVPEDETRYFGVGFDPLYLIKLSLEGVAPAIDCWMKKWPLLRDEAGIVAKVVRRW